MRLALTFETQRIELELLETATTRALTQALPVRSCAQTWGEEVHFSTPVKAKLEKDARQVVAPGTVCFRRRLAAVKAGEGVRVEKV
jgi:hypothetical protein